MRYHRVHLAQLAYELGPIVVSTDEIEERLEPAFRSLKAGRGQVEALTGIVERRFWPKGYRVSEGAAVAGQAALARAMDDGFDLGDLGAVIYAGVCRDHFEPATACHVAGRLIERGLELPPALEVQDLSNACLGVVSGILAVANRIELGQIRAGLVVSCESAREIVDINIETLNASPNVETFAKALATMTGGSAAAAVLVTDAALANGRRQLLGASVRAAPQHHGLCTWGVDRSDDGRPSHRREFMWTDSVGVLEHGLALGKQTYADLQALLDLSARPLDRTVCHQVGSRHRDEVLATLGLLPEHDFVTYDFLGNTGTAALPVAAALAEERGFVEAGQLVGLLGIGSGLNCTMLGVNW